MSYTPTTKRGSDKLVAVRICTLGGRRRRAVYARTFARTLGVRTYYAHLLPAQPLHHLVLPAALAYPCLSLLPPTTLFSTPSAMLSHPTCLTASSSSSLPVSSLHHTQTRNTAQQQRQQRTSYIAAAPAYVTWTVYDI